MQKIKKEWRQNEKGAYMFYCTPYCSEEMILGFYPEKKNGQYYCTWVSEIMEVEHDYEYFNTIDDAKKYLEGKFREWIIDQVEIYKSYLECVTEE